MKAAVLYKANTPLEVVDVKQEDPKAGEARVKVKAAGVCHSDWHIMNGDWTLPLPMVLGHEAAGIVEDGRRRRDHREARRPRHLLVPAAVRPLPLLLDRPLGPLRRPQRHAALGACSTAPRACRATASGINQLARIGTFAEKVVCPAEQLVPIRKDMPWPQAALMGCCVPTGVGAVTRCAEVEAGASVLVIGCGGVGLNVVQGARLAGAGTIVAVRPARHQARPTRRTSAPPTR